MSTPARIDPLAIAAHFVHSHIASVQSFGAGNVNDTFLVTPSQGSAFVMQRINTHVFRQPALILGNMRRFSEHVQQRLAVERKPGSGRPRAWETPMIVPTRDSQDYLLDDEGGFWRAITLIENARSYPRIRNAEHACESGYALGRFQNLISDLKPDLLHDTLPGFHITPQYLAKYDEVLAHVVAPANVRASDPAALRYGHAFVAQRREWASVLETALAQGKLALRTMHGDPKVDNIMIDNASGQAMSIVDLDTVKPGLVHYDIGDCLRSCCNFAGEETSDLNVVDFNLGLCQSILTGYLGEAGRFFTVNDYEYMYDSIRLITFELGLRFFSDHLAGNVYFKAKHPQHNLQRALVQFRLAESIEAQEGAIRQIIANSQGHA